MLKRLWLAVMLWLSCAVVAQAQEVVFVQIEAKRNLQEATVAARGYAGDLPDVAGFSLGNGWYAIALGPYVREDAEEVLRVYRREGVIARDSFLALPSAFGRQFWPIGDNVLGRGTQPAPAVTAAPEPTPEPEPQAADETPTEARDSESRLTAQERRDLQIALQWAGTYSGGIDGAFGRGTRNAMAQWQLQNGYVQTGILTTLQRRDLLSQYNSILDGLDLGEIENQQAGIALAIPRAALRFAGAQTPFATYDGTGVVDGARLILISQAGDQSTLFGLYDIMQTLEIVPLDGPRQRGQRGFTLTGENDQIVSFTEVRLQNGEIKGFTLVWPAGDEERRTRLLDEMKKSFRTLPGVLPASLDPSADQAVDLVSGLEVRTPRLSRTGFFVDSAGTVVTTLEAVSACGRITLDEDTQARVVLRDEARGIAILQPEASLAPRAVARFSAGVPRLQSEIAVAGYSYGGVLGAASMTFGTISDLRGLGGEPDLKRLALNVLPGDAGGPVFDAGGGVLGMLLPRQTPGRTLPEDVNFAANAGVIQDLLQQAGLAAAETDSSRPIDPIDLTNAAQNMTVLVSCWD